LVKLLPDFGPENWTSLSRDQVSGLAAYRGPRRVTSFYYPDKHGILTSMVYDEERREAWTDKWPTYHLAVESTSGRASDPFYMNQALIEHVSTIRVVWLCCADTYCGRPYDSLSTTQPALRKGYPRSSVYQMFGLVRHILFTAIRIVSSTKEDCELRQALKSPWMTEMIYTLHLFSSCSLTGRDLFFDEIALYILLIYTCRKRANASHGKNSSFKSQVINCCNVFVTIYHEQNNGTLSVYSVV